MKDFAMQLTQKCVSMGLLDESYSEWFAYSIEKKVTALFTWLVQCLIGGFCFGWTLTISFSVFFLLIRKYTNGYHAATYSKCLFCSILLEVVLLASISYVFRTGLALLFLTIVADSMNYSYPVGSEPKNPTVSVKASFSIKNYGSFTLKAVTLSRPESL